MMLKEKKSNSQKWSKGFLDSKESGAAHQFHLDPHGDGE